MSDTMLSFAAIRNYSWWLLRTNLGWNTADYGGRVPLVPFSDEPALTQYDKPYIIYNFTESADNRINIMTTGTFTFIVRSKHLSDITSAINVLTEAFRSEDESAAMLNKFTTQVGGYGNLLFQTTSAFYSEPGSAETTEEGRISGLLSIHYTYIQDVAFTLDSDNFAV